MSNPPPDTLAESAKKPRRGLRLAALRTVERRARQHAEAVKAEILLHDQSGGGIERDEGEDGDLTQAEILRLADVETRSKKLSLTLERGPYIVDYSRDGRFMMAAGRKGDLYIVDALKNVEVSHCFPDETIRAARMCYTEQCLALAQRKYVYLYDKDGMQFMCFRSLRGVTALDYLPYHFLLVMVSPELKQLAWRDITHGEYVAKQKVLRATGTALQHNRSNGIAYVGNVNGSVSLYAPTCPDALMEFYAMPGSVTSVCPFLTNYVAVGGSCVKIFDIRKASTELVAITASGPDAASIDCSQTGLLAIGRGSIVNVWRDIHHAQERRNPAACRYLSHRYENGTRVSSVKFRPYEDVLAVGHSRGLDTLLVPGAGQAVIDTMEGNPYATKNEKGRRFIRQLIEKLPPETIVFDPTKIGAI